VRPDGDRLADRASGARQSQGRRSSRRPAASGCPLRSALSAVVLVVLVACTAARAQADGSRSVCREARAIGDFAALTLVEQLDSELQTRAVVYRAADGVAVAFLYLDQRARRILQYRAAADGRDHAAFGSPYAPGQQRVDAAVLQYMAPTTLPRGYLLKPCA
jgi:hypothetical protein